MKKARYIAEAIVLRAFFVLCLALPVDAASGLGGWIGRTAGPRLAASRKARANIARALPECGQAAQDRIIRDMWDNLGRVMAEYPHLKTLARTRTTIEDAALFDRIREDGRPGVIVSAHLANWEIAGPAALLQGGFELDLVYREPNNPMTAAILARARAVAPGPRSMAKSRAGARDLVRALAEGRHVGILIDQKYNEGMAVPFFGHPAMTSPAFVQLAQKFSCPLVLTRIERLGGARFRVSARELACTAADGGDLPREQVMVEAHAHLEAWIRERPGQWLWLHRRWPGNG